LSELDAPAAAELSLLTSLALLLEVPPDEEVEPCGQEQFAAGLLVLDEVLPEALDCEESLLLVDGLVLDVEPEAPVEGCEVLPLAEVEPEALPEPDDWLVCAPWSIVEDGLVVVAFWSAVAPLDELTLPEPMFTSGLTFAPAFTSVLLMPTFASTPTFGFTLVLLDEPPAALGCELEGWLVCADWSVLELDDDCAKAGPNAPITAAAVILTAKFRRFISLILSPR